MKRLLVGLLSALILLSAFASASWGLDANGSGLDQHGADCFPNSQTFTETVSSSAPNALLVFIVQLNTVAVTGISDSMGLSWNGPRPNFGATGVTNMYWAAKPNAGADTVTVTLPDFEHFKVLWFTVLGADQYNPFDGAAASFSGPNAGSNTFTGRITTTNPYDFVFSYSGEIGSAVPSNIVTANPPFSILDGTNNGCYSQSIWMAYTITSTTLNGYFSPLSYTLTNQITGSMDAIRLVGTPPSSTTTTTTTTTTVTTTSCTSTQTIFTTRTILAGTVITNTVLVGCTVTSTITTTSTSCSVNCNIIDPNTLLLIIGIMAGTIIVFIFLRRRDG